MIWVFLFLLTVIFGLLLWRIPPLYTWVKDQLTSLIRQRSRISTWIKNQLTSLIGLILNPKPAGETAWTHLLSWAKILALAGFVVTVIAFVGLLMQSRGRIVLAEVELSGNLSNKLRNQPLTKTAIQQELFSRLRGRRSARETFERMQTSIEQLDMYADIAPLFWIDDVPYRYGREYLAVSDQAGKGPFRLAPLFGSQLPGIEGDVKVFDTISLKANDLVRWLERTVLGRDLARLSIYSLGQGLIANVTTDSGRVWEIKEQDVLCLNLGVRRCTNQRLPAANIAKRLGDLIDALAQRMTLTAGTPELERDWIGAAQVVAAMRDLNEGQETQQRSSFERARTKALLAFEDPSLTPQARYIALLTAMDAYQEGFKLFGNPGTEPDLHFSSACKRMEPTFTNESIIRSIDGFGGEDAVSGLVFFTRVAEVASEAMSFSISFAQLQPMFARLAWHAALRARMISACAVNPSQFAGRIDLQIPIDMFLYLDGIVENELPGYEQTAWIRDHRNELQPSALSYTQGKLYEQLGQRSDEARWAEIHSKLVAEHFWMDLIPRFSAAFPVQLNEIDLKRSNRLQGIAAQFLSTAEKAITSDVPIDYIENKQLDLNARAILAIRAGLHVIKASELEKIKGTSRQIWLYRERVITTREQLSAAYPTQRLSPLRQATVLMLLFNRVWRDQVDADPKWLACVRARSEDAGVALERLISDHPFSTRAYLTIFESIQENEVRKGAIEARYNAKDWGNPEAPCP
jgi:hypothetical protein